MSITIEENKLQAMIEASMRRAELVRHGLLIRKWFTKQEVAEMFGFSVSWVNDKIKEGVFEINKSKGSVTMISRRSIENYK